MFFEIPGPCLAQARPASCAMICDGFAAHHQVRAFFRDVPGPTMEHDERSTNGHEESRFGDEDAEPHGADDATDAAGGEVPRPLARVRFGLGKELRLYADEFVILHQEAGDEIRLRLDSIRRLILAPGEQVPSKLVLMFDLDDGNTIIAAEGMSNVRDFRGLLAKVVEIRPAIELDPPDMDEQLRQALDIRRRSLLGCYGVVVAFCVVLWIVYLVVAFIGAHAHAAH